MAAIPTPQGELEVGRRGYQPAATPFSVGKGGARQTPCRQPPWRTQTSHHSGPRLPSPCPKTSAAKRIMLRPAHDEIDIAAADSEQQSRLLQSGIVVLVPYRAAISAGSGRLDWRQSLQPDDQRQMSRSGDAERHWQAGEGLQRRLRYRPRRGGSYCLVGGVGSRTGSGLSLARIALSVLIAQAGQKRDPGLAAAGNLANVG